MVIFGGGHAATIALRAAGKGLIKPSAIAAVAPTWAGPLPIVFGRSAPMESRYMLVLIPFLAFSSKNEYPTSNSMCPPSNFHFTQLLLVVSPNLKLIQGLFGDAVAFGQKIIFDKSCVLILKVVLGQDSFLLSSQYPKAIVTL